MMYLVTLVFIILLFAEGSGIPFVHEYLLYAYIVLPIFMYLIIRRKNIIAIPLYAAISFAIFVIFSLISTLFVSVDKQNSFESTLYYYALFLIFIFFYNFKKEAKHIINFSLLLSPVFIILSALLTYTPLHNLVRNSGLSYFQFVLPISGTHNHIGDYLGMLIIFLIISPSIKSGVLKIIALSVGLFFFVSSFSQSAYMAFIIVLFYILLFHKRYRLSPHITSTLLIVLILVETVLLIISSYNNPYFGSLLPSFAKSSSVPVKKILSERPEYFTQAIKAFYEKPLFGTGPGNFLNISMRYRSYPTLSTSSAHNVLLEVLSEGGILAFIGFYTLLFLVFKKVVNDYSVYSLLFLYLFLNFQTDYTYQIYSLFTLFIIIAASIYTEKRSVQVKTSCFGINALLLFVVVIIITVSNVFLLLGKPTWSIRLYPFNKNAYISELKMLNQPRDNALISEYLTSYIKIAEDDLDMLFITASFYKTQNQPETALKYFEKMYQNNKYVPTSIISEIYHLKKSHDPVEGNRFLSEVAMHYRKIPPHLLSAQYMKEFNDLCKEARKTVCSETGWE